MYELSQDRAGDAVKAAAQCIARYCAKNGIHDLVTGVSGGLDSAVVIGINQRAVQYADIELGFSLKSIGMILPCHSAPEAESLALQAMEKFGTYVIKSDLTVPFDAMIPSFTKTRNDLLDVLRVAGDTDSFHPVARRSKVAQGNIKARMRMMNVYYVANLLGGMVMSTDNYSEEWMAFWTLHGDVGDFAPIQKVMKGLELYEVAKYLGVPQGIIDAMPDDGLGIAGGDADQIGADYRTIDTIMVTLIQNGFEVDGSKEQLKYLPGVKGIDEATVLLIATRCLEGSFKRKISASIALTRSDLGLPEIMDIKL